MTELRKRAESLHKMPALLIIYTSRDKKSLTFVETGVLTSRPFRYPAVDGRCRLRGDLERCRRGAGDLDRLEDVAQRAGPLHAPKGLESLRTQDRRLHDPRLETFHEEEVTWSGLEMGLDERGGQLEI
jgi:hypothetical protein